MLSDKFISRVLWLSVIILIISVTITWVYYWIFGHFVWFGDIDDTKIGNFGEFITAIISISTSFITIILLYQTYNTQHIELKEQRTLMEQQKFENTFFNLISNLHEIVRSTKYQENDDIFQGKQFFDSLAIKISNYHTDRGIETFNFQVIEEIYYKHKIRLAHYINIVFVILFQIKNSKGDLDKSQYIKILQAQFSIGELRLIKYISVLKEYSIFSTLANELNLFEPILK